MHVSETLINLLSSFTNKALPISVQGFGASLAPVSFLTAWQHLHNEPVHLKTYFLNSILYSTAIQDSNPNSRPVRTGVLPHLNYLADILNIDEVFRVSAHSHALSLPTPLLPYGATTSNTCALGVTSRIVVLTY